MAWNSPIRFAENKNVLRDVGDSHIAIHDWSQSGKLFKADVNPSLTTGAEQEGILDHETAVLETGGSRPEFKCLAFLKIAPTDARDLTKIIELEGAGNCADVIE